MKFLGERCKMIVEPTAALGLAGLDNMIREGKIKDGARVGTVLTGGNIDLAKYCKIIGTES
jgi:threonine dehydratase